jgi:hypothetical protein
MVTASTTFQTSNLPPVWVNCSASAGQWRIQSTDDYPPFNQASFSGSWIFTNSSLLAGCMTGKVFSVAIYKANTCTGPNDCGSIYTYTPPSTITEDACPVSIISTSYTIGCQPTFGALIIGLLSLPMVVVVK